MSKYFSGEPRRELLTYLNTLTGDDLARAVFANAVWGDTAAYRALADQLDLETTNGFGAAQQLSRPGPPMSQRPKPARMKGTPFEYDVFDAAIMVAKHKHRIQEGDDV